MTVRRGKLRPWSMEVNLERKVKSTRMKLKDLLRMLYQNQELYGLPPEPFI